MDTLVTHPLFGYRVNYRRVLEIQARLLARVLTGEIGIVSGLHDSVSDWYLWQFSIFEIRLEIGTRAARCGENPGRRSQAVKVMNSA